MKKRFSLSLILSILLLANTVYAEVYNLTIKNDFLPASASGLLLDRGELATLEILSITEKGNNFYKIEFQAPDNKINALISLNLIAEDGVSKTTGFMPLDSTKNFHHLSASLPACADYQPPESVYRNASVIERLVELREERLANRQTEIARLLNTESLEKLIKIEAGLGLNYEQTLSLELPFIELADRLSTIRSLLISYKMQQIRK